MAGKIFLVSRLLADEHAGRRGAAFAKDGLRGIAVKVAAVAIQAAF